MKDIFQCNCEICQSIRNDFNKPIMSHNAKMILGLALVIIIGGLTALQSIGTGGAWVSTVIAILVLIQHATGGNTGTPTSTSTTP